MKKRHAIALVLLSVALSHVLSPALSWAQAKAQTAFYSLTVTDTVTASGDVTADQYVASGSASQYSCSKTDGTCQFSSATADGTTSATVGAFTMKAAANIGSADAVLDVQDSAAAHIFRVTEAGSLLIPDSQSLAIGSYHLSNNASNGRFYLGSASLTGDGVLWLGSIVTLTAGIDVATTVSGGAKLRGTCTLNAASPSTCTATVTAASICTCSIVGGTAAIAAKGCAVGLSGTTLTITSANGANENVNYTCFL